MQLAHGSLHAVEHHSPFTNPMRLLPRNEEEGIADAQQALDDLRLFLRKRTRGKAGDKRYALQFQLENLEDMLRVVTDRRYARSLSEQGTILRGPSDTTLDTLQFIVSTARGAMNSNATTPSPSTAGTRIGRATEPLNIAKSLTPGPPAASSQGGFMLSSLRYPNDSSAQPLTLRQDLPYLPP